MKQVTLDMGITAAEALAEWDAANQDEKCSKVRREALFRRFTLLRNREGRSGGTPPEPVSYLEGATGATRYVANEREAAPEPPEPISKPTHEPTKPMQTIAKRFANLLEKLNYNAYGGKRALAAKAGVSYSSVSALQSGKDLSPETLAKFAAALGTSVEWLSDGKGEMQADEVAPYAGARGKGDSGKAGRRDSGKAERVEKPRRAPVSAEPGPRRQAAAAASDSGDLMEELRAALEAQAAAASRVKELCAAIAGK